MYAYPPYRESRGGRFCHGPSIPLERQRAGQAMREWPEDQKRKSGFPRICSETTEPNSGIRLMKLLPRLSPTTKNVPSGTLVDLNMEYSAGSSFCWMEPPRTSGRMSGLRP
jgi:hypothetical protein